MYMEDINTDNVITKKQIMYTKDKEINPYSKNISM